MAQNYILLTLDTTAPTIEVLMPNYTTIQAKTEIRVTTNETLAEWQEIYIIDSSGERHELTFRHDENGLVGIVIFENYPLGISTIYARVMDEVGNKSIVASRSIYIMASEKLSVSISESVSDITVKSENYQRIMVEGESLNKVLVEDKVSNQVTTRDEDKKIIVINSKEVR